ncbi:hypothetical protein AB0912_08185 [Streptomyces sp. NPDC007084]|uniref:hypothetical protein n=1 Tax=Streptomyces sp. NPDC007084 TaxID=3154313 RepID=UPI003455E4A2
MARRSARKKRAFVDERAEGAERNPSPPKNTPAHAEPVPVPVSLPASALDHARVIAAYSRSPRSRRTPAVRPAPRPRVEVSVNELTGMMSWRTVQPPVTGAEARRGRQGDRNGGGGAADGPPGLRTKNSHGAAPIPANPADVRAAVNVSLASLPPEQLRRHLAVVEALRSHVTADVAVGAKLPLSVAAHLRAGATPAAVHALSEERADTTRELKRTAPAAPAAARTSPQARARHR